MLEKNIMSKRIHHGKLTEKDLLRLEVGTTIFVKLAQTRRYQFLNYNHITNILKVKQKYFRQQNAINIFPFTILSLCPNYCDAPYLIRYVYDNVPKELHANPLVVADWLEEYLEDSKTADQIRTINNYILRNYKHKSTETFILWHQYLG